MPHVMLPLHYSLPPPAKCHVVLSLHHVLHRITPCITPHHMPCCIVSHHMSLRVVPQIAFSICVHQTVQTEEQQASAHPALWPLPAKPAPKCEAYWLTCPGKRKP